MLPQLHHWLTLVEFNSTHIPYCTYDDGNYVA